MARSRTVQPWKHLMIFTVAPSPYGEQHHWQAFMNKWLWPQCGNLVRHTHRHVCVWGGPGQWFLWQEAISPMWVWMLCCKKAKQNKDLCNWNNTTPHSILWQVGEGLHPPPPPQGVSGELPTVLCAQHGGVILTHLTRGFLMDHNIQP